MKNIWSSFIVAFAMYSKIPMPKTEWTKDHMKYSMCFFPFVGMAVGLIEYGWFLLASYLRFGAVFRAAGMTLIPVLVTGGIHMDGYLDTMDALSSWREKNQRLVILKDPHAGAFAIITGVVWFLISFAAATEITGKMMPIYCAIFVVSRCFSGLSVICFHNANPKGSAAAFSDQAQKKATGCVLIIYLAILLVVMCSLNPVQGITCFGTGLAVFFYYRWKSYKYFGGITGDLAGYFLSLAELLMQLAVIFAATIMGKL